jgi:hypothetical protein
LTIVCNGCVYLYWFGGVPTWTAHYTALWPLLHRIPYQPSPKFEVLIGSVVSGFLDEQDSWVRVEGVLGLKRVGDLLFPLIQADRITAIDPPRNPYLFPGLF